MSVLGLSGLGNFVSTVTHSKEIISRQENTSSTWKKVQIAVTSFFSNCYNIPDQGEDS